MIFQKKGKITMLNYYKDLTDYEYYMHVPIPEVKNIGWLDDKHVFTTGDVDSDVLKKLELSIFNSYEEHCNILVNELRGSYECPICGKHKEKITNGDDRFTLGSAELWIPDCREKDKYFATFGLIIHYIREHNYKPPKEFIDSILALDLKAKFSAQEIRDKFSERSFQDSEKLKITEKK
jgi:hypothetical protein